MDEDEPPPPPPSRPSQIPSWVMLGFILGAGFVLALPRREARPDPQAAARPVAATQVLRIAAAPPRVTTVEAVFATWGRYAVWDNDLTEIGVWNPAAGQFTDFFEVLRFADGYYFRSIPLLTRPVLTHGIPSGSPLEFTETEAQRREWLKERDASYWETVGGSKGESR